MSATGTVDLARTTEPQRALARLAVGLRDRLPETHKERLLDAVDRIPPNARPPADIPDRCYRWFDSTFLPAILDRTSIDRHGRDFTKLRESASARWSQVKREQATTWLNAWDRGAAALWDIGASVVWQELGDRRAEATPGWDAAASAIRVVAATQPDVVDTLVDQLRTSVLDLFDGIVEATR